MRCEIGFFSQATKNKNHEMQALDVIITLRSRVCITQKARRVGYCFAPLMQRPFGCFYQYTDGA